MFLDTRPKIYILLIIVIVFLSNNGERALGDSSPSVHERKRPPPEPLKEMIKKDNARHKGMEHRAKLWKTLPKPSKWRTLMEEEEDVPLGEREGPLKSTIKGAIKLPMFAAAEYEMGQYVVDIAVGTPPVKLRMVADTGSDITWVKCNHGKRVCGSGKGAFNAGQSSTFKPFACGNSLCSEEFKMLSSLDVCPNFDAPCLYNHSYPDEGLTTYGQFAKDTITLETTKGVKVTLPNMLIGCSESYSGKAIMNHADGILGLGMHPYSFALHAVTKFGGAFSFCLVDHLSSSNVTNYLIFGDHDKKDKSPTQEFMRYTVLHVNEESPFYWVYVKGISVGDKMLDIIPVVWDGMEGGGTILDSGTAATYWVEPAYRAIMDALIPFFEKKYPILPGYRGDGVSQFEYCFNSSKPFSKSKVPLLQIHFRDGARFKPHVKSYIIDGGPNIKCIGFLEAASSVNIIGNILQQNYLWEFDVHHETVGFVASTCE